MKFLPPGGPTCVDTSDNEGGPVPSWWVMGNGKQGACYGPNWALQLFSYMEEGSLAALAGGSDEGPGVRRRGRIHSTCGTCKTRAPELGVPSTKMSAAR